MLCKHCRSRVGTRPRGLCYHCYGTVKEDYPSTSVYANRGVGVLYPRKVPAPTKARPGSREKLEELIRRAESGEVLWHPLDEPQEGP